MIYRVNVRVSEPIMHDAIYYYRCLRSLENQKSRRDGEDDEQEDESEADVAAVSRLSDAESSTWLIRQCGGIEGLSSLSVRK